jgi:hypothetical protein
LEIVRVEQPGLEHEVKMGGLCVCGEGVGDDRKQPLPANLVTFGVGSCLVITLFDAKKKIGALAHAMLPTRKKVRKNASSSEDASGRYVDVAIAEMLEQMQSLGSDGKNLEAKLIGAANMFSGLSPEIRKSLKTTTLGWSPSQRGAALDAPFRFRFHQGL